MLISVCGPDVAVLGLQNLQHAEHCSAIIMKRSYFVTSDASMASLVQVAHNDLALLMAMGGERYLQHLTRNRTASRRLCRKW